MKKAFNASVWIWIIANALVLLIPAILTPLSETFGFQNINTGRMYQIVGVIDPVIAIILAAIGIVAGKDQDHKEN